MSEFSRTSLTPYAASMRDPDPQGARRAAQELYDRLGVVTIFPGDMRPGADAMWIEAIGKRLYGQAGRRK